MTPQILSTTSANVLVANVEAGAVFEDYSRSILIKIIFMGKTIFKYNYNSLW